MRKLKKQNEIIVHVKTEKVSDFFERGRKIAKRLDSGKSIPAQRIISFEDPADLVKFITQSKRDLVAAIRKEPKSISSLASELHRSRSAIDKDVQMLEDIGIVTSQYVSNPGHGRCRIIKAAVAGLVRLQVDAII